VPCPDQTGVPEGGLRFVLCFRAVGEGHVSSVVFRRGVIDREGSISLDPVSRFVQTPEVVMAGAYDRGLFCRRLDELGFLNRTSRRVCGHLPEHFGLTELQAVVGSVEEEAPGQVDSESLRTMLWLANSNYELRFDPELPVSECVIFPVSRNERTGIEDARFVRFLADDGQAIYYATYTAFNGVTTMPQIIETRDFRYFKVSSLYGSAAKNKGMALFPRRVAGKYVMVTRHDGENLYIAQSDDVRFWDRAELLLTPKESWNLFLIGNCGSPIETKQGWLLLTHGVGPMRRYCISAVLLDLDEPGRVVGRLREPLLSPTEIEREGYVPNVVYSCGSLAHNGQLIIPYAISDTSSGIATVSLHSLLDRLLAEGP
jgi:predicted GH43/DUF377 family glycosyl hydrolase